MAEGDLELIILGPLGGKWTILLAALSNLAGLGGTAGEEAALGLGAMLGLGEVDPFTMT